MIEKPKRPKKISNQDNKQPQTIQELIRRYDLDNTKIYDFLDEFIEYLKQDREDIDTLMEDARSNRLKRVYARTHNGGTTADTELTVNGGYGGGAYLVVNTWHTSAGANTGTTIDIISLNYDGGGFKANQICKINNGTAGKEFSYSVSETETLQVHGTSPGAFTTTIYNL